MDELILLALQGRATQRQLDELRAWRRRSADNEARYLELSALLQIASLHPEIDRESPVPSADRLLRDEPVSARPVRRRSPVLARALTLVAAMVVGIFIGARFTSRPAEVREAVFHTDSGDMASAALDDGTVVRLAPNTQLRVMLGPDTRQVFLQGRAYFAVARDPSRPFRVQTDEGEATALGTRFEVDTRDDRFRLLVVDGRVAVSRGQQDVELRAGELGEAVRGAPTSVTRVEDPAALLDWLGAFVAFESTPLHRVARELQLQLGIEIEIVDAGIADRTVTAWFGEEDRDEVVRVICRTADLHCEQVGEVVQMRARPQGSGR